MGSAKKKKRLVIAVDKPTPGSQRQPLSSRTSYFIALLLILAAALLYGHSLWNPLVFDDAAVLFDANLERLGSSLFHLDLRWFSYASFGWTYKLVGMDWFWQKPGVPVRAREAGLLRQILGREMDIRHGRGIRG